MILYLAAAVVGVVLIVFLVLQLTKSSGNNAAGGSPTQSTGTSTAAAPGAAGSGYALTQASKVGAFPLNQAVTRQLTTIATNRWAPVAARIKSSGAGQPGQPVVGIYDLGSVSSYASSTYKGLVFVGYNGTFDPQAVIRLERSALKSSRLVKAGPHGGEMICGYDTSTGKDASECVFVTKTTFGTVEFLEHGSNIKYPGASAIALQVRQAVEVPAKA